MNTMKTKPLHDRLRSSKNVVLPQTTNRIPVDSIILILKITKGLNQQFNTYNLYGLSSFLNSLVARHHTCYSIVALSAAHQKHTKNRRLTHASTMLGVPVCYDSQSNNVELHCDSHPKGVELVADSSDSFFNIVEQQRLPEPGFSLHGEDNSTIFDCESQRNVQNGQQTQVPFKLSRDYSFEEEGFED